MIGAIKNAAAVTLGKLGGQATLKKRGRRHFEKISKMGHEARWYLKRKRGYRGWKEANKK